MKPTRLVLASLLALATPALVACDSGDAEVATVRTATLGADTGVDMTSGAVHAPGHYANSDLYATANGDHLKLATGGDTPTASRPVNWFLGAGGLAATFAGLADVPDERPEGTSAQALPRPRAGNGFVLLTRRGTWVKGFIREATATGVTVEYVRL